jgi:transposase InsO family protein
MEKPSEGKNVPANKGTLVDFKKLTVTASQDEIEDDGLDDKPGPMADNVVSAYSIAVDDPQMLESFLNHPPLQEMQNPMDPRRIQQFQFEDQQLEMQRQQNPQRFPVKFVQGRPLVCYKMHPNDPEGAWKIALPTGLLDGVVGWYHRVLGHCGITRLYDTIRTHCYHPHLKRKCELLHCDACQLNKQLGAGYGELPPREAPLVPWDEVCVDLIGPWKIEIQGREIEFNALTSIDPVTNLVELVRIDNKTSHHIATQFENSWLSRYPRPNRCVHDNGGEFIGWEFQRLLQQVGIKDVATTSRNPQANAVCERMHQTVGNILRTLLHVNRPQNAQAAAQLVDEALATAMHAMRCAASRTLGISPGALVFHRDMILDLPVIADLLTIRDKRQVLIDENLRRQNLKRRSFDYQVGQDVLIKAISPSKLEPRAHGPYRIVQVHVNGNLTVQRAPHVLERVNIRRVVPYRR